MEQFEERLVLSGGQFVPPVLEGSPGGGASARGDFCDVSMDSSSEQLASVAASSRVDADVVSGADELEAAMHSIDSYVNFKGQLIPPELSVKIG